MRQSTTHTSFCNARHSDKGRDKVKVAAGEIMAKSSKVFERDQGRTYGPDPFSVISSSYDDSFSSASCVYGSQFYDAFSSYHKAYTE
jgi:hypothetical protein